METETTRRSEEGAVIRWRCEQLRSSGFTAAEAAVLAGNHRYDLHVLIELVERGCPPSLATRILAPLEEEDVA